MEHTNIIAMLQSIITGSTFVRMVLFFIRGFNKTETKKLKAAHRDNAASLVAIP